MKNTNEKTKESRSLVEREIQRRKNLRQFKDRKFGVIVPAKKARELEILDVYGITPEEFDKRQRAEKRKVQVEREKRDRIRKERMADKKWRRRGQEKRKTEKGELRSFKDLALVFKESREN